MILLETLPIFVGIFFSYIFWQNNFILFIIYLGLTFGLISFHKDRAEFAMFAYGLIVGFVIEVFDTRIAGYQSFANPDFLGIPMWLPIAWGYGFVGMKRVGFIIKNYDQGFRGKNTHRKSRK